MPTWHSYTLYIFQHVQCAYYTYTMNAVSDMRDKRPVTSASSCSATKRPPRHVSQDLCLICLEVAFKDLPQDHVGL